jgi:hypothetical protein
MIADCQLLIADFIRAKPKPGDGRNDQIGNRKSAIGNRPTHPLPRGGTDFIDPHVV